MTTAYTRPRILRADQLRDGDQLPFSPDVPEGWDNTIGTILLDLDAVDDRTVWLTATNVRRSDRSGDIFLDLDDRPEREFQPYDDLVVRESVEVD